MTRNERLDELFERWATSMSKDQQALFVRDGIVDEPEYDRQRLRVLFVLAEANATYKPVIRYNRDLRCLYREDVCGKFFNQSLARWTRLLLDGERVSFRDAPERACRELRRIATMNLKKVGGGGRAEPRCVLEFALDHRSFLLEQIEIIQPNLIIACGAHVREALPTVLHGVDTQRLEAATNWRESVVLPSAHPSWADDEERVDETLRTAWLG